ncbi:RDD family protein [Lentzea sp. BCCO 10_0061]|uniref:RDD family protein n=1 Tax=Lentzea sokolovensis TaxID=3095429 RepID=A0ABU4V945_9PSEU|nr:RDD family protein [Lentzea sp. BCCO 10_0061]MDX8148311.1 RDD family protein [Lentzea sp. BCCO 10_0061]
MNAPQPPGNQFGGQPQQEPNADATQIVPGGGQPAAANPNPDATQVVSPGQAPAAPQHNADATQVVSPGQVPPAAPGSGGFPAQGPGSGGFPAQQPPQYGAPQQPYGQPQQPYGAPQSNPYGQPQQQPYGQPQQPYGAPQSSPYGQPQQQAYGQPGGYGQPGYAPAPPTGYAEWGPRAVAGLIDYVAPGVVAAIIIGVFAGIGASTGDASTGGIFVLLAYVVGYGGLFGFFIWNTVLKGGSTGQSLGKKVAKIKVIKEDTQQPPGGGTAFLRLLLNYAFGLLCGIGSLVNYLSPLWNKPKNETYSDKICGTVVINWPDTASYGGGGYGQPQQQAYGQPNTGGYPQQPQQGGYGQPPQQGYGGQQQGW